LFFLLAFAFTLGAGPVPDKPFLPEPPPKPTDTETSTPTETPTGTRTPEETATPTVTWNGTEEIVLPVPMEYTETPTPEPTLPPVDLSKAGAGPILPELSVFPNPVRGKQVTFRFQSDELWKLNIVLYDGFGRKEGELEREGGGLLDVLWPVDNVESGIFYYRIKAEQLSTGRVLKYPVGKFMVDRIEQPTPTPRPRKRKPGK
jgi:hypothetical protein